MYLLLENTKNGWAVKLIHNKRFVRAFYSSAWMKITKKANEWGTRIVSAN